MNWIEVHIDTQPAELDGLCARLEELGITGLVIDDEADFKNFLENNHQYWDYVDESLLQEKKGLCRVTFYLSDEPAGRGGGSGRWAARRTPQPRRRTGRRLGEQLEAVL